MMPSFLDKNGMAYQSYSEKDEIDISLDMKTVPIDESGSGRLSMKINNVVSIPINSPDVKSPMSNCALLSDKTAPGVQSGLLPIVTSPNSKA